MSLRSPVAWFVPFLVVLAAAPAHAQPSPDEIAKAIRDLASPKFRVREKASAVLWSGGRKAEMAILRALKKADLETARRAEKVLEKFRWGIYPDTPKEVLPLIARYRSGQPADRTGVLRELFQRGRAHYRLIARLLAAENTPQQRAQVASAFLRSEVEPALRKRLREHDFAGLEDLLEIRTLNGSAKTARDYAVCLLLNGRLDRAIAPLAAYAELPGRKREAHLLAQLCRVKGDLSAARRFAEKAGDLDLLQAILVEQGDWKELSARADKLVGEDGLLDFKAFFHRRAGNTQAFERAVAELIKTARANPAAGAGTVWWEVKTLFLNDRPAEAMMILEQDQNEDGILEMLIRQRRFNEALRRLDRNAKQNDNAHQIATIRKARLLNHLGEMEVARKLLDGIRKKAVSSSGSWKLCTTLLEAEREVGRTDETMRLWAQLVERGPPKATANFAPQPSPAQYAGDLLGKLLGRETSELHAWWVFLRAKYGGAISARSRPTEQTLSTVKQLKQILDGKLPREEFTALVREALATARKKPRTEQESRLNGLADTCRRVGRDDLLRACLEASAEAVGSQAAHVNLAKFLAGKKLWADVAAVCVRARKRYPDDGVLTLLHGHALKQSGRAAEGRELEKAARLLPLADGDARHALAKTLAELGRHDEARREFALVTRSGLRMAWTTREAWRELSGYAARAGDDLRAAACWERWYLGVIGRGSFFLSHEPYIWVPYRLHFLRARGLLAKGDESGALAEIRVCQRLLPNEIETAATFVPLLARHKHKHEADELFAKTYATYQALCKEYPHCDWAHNSLAWLSARCRRNLDVALEHGREAVRLAPDNARFLDTLAEVHFQRGERDEAVQLMRRCIQLVPSREYYRNQLRRFEAGDRSKEVKE